MSSKTTGIQWTDRTWNPVVGCSRVSEGCRNCYAESMARRIACAADSRATKIERCDAGDPPAWGHSSPATPLSGSPAGPGRRPSKKTATAALTETQRAYQAVVRTKVGADGAVVRLPQWNGNVRLIEEVLTEPLRWKKRFGAGSRVFVNSMSDLFHENLRFEDIDRVFAVMALCSNITFQVLTKRPQRMAEYLGNDTGLHGVSFRVVMAIREFVGRGAPFQGKIDTSHLGESDRLFPLPNVWLGTSVEDQKAAEERIPHLLRCPVGGAAVRFLSVEPMLGAVDLAGWLHDAGDVSPATPLSGSARGDGGDTSPPSKSGISWVIAGGESGKGARPCDVDWIRSIVRQCRSAGVPVFVKQMGSVCLMRHDSIEGRRAGDHPEREWPLGTIRFGNRTGDRAPNGMQVLLRDSHGADMDEWPEDVRVREFPG